MAQAVNANRNGDLILGSTLRFALSLSLLTFSFACARRKAPGEQPSQTFQGLAMRQTKHGELQWTLQALEATLREAEGAVDLRSPRVSLYDRGRAVSDIRSRHGRFLQASQDLSLDGDVVVAGLAGAEAGTTLKTEALDYASADRLFKTDQPVLIERPGSRLTGRGMTAKHDLSEIRIHRQEARFE